MLIIAISVLFVSCDAIPELTDVYSLDGNNCSDNIPLIDKTYYVSKTGDDSFDGMSREQAFKTLFKAIQQACPGDTILIAPGIYTEGLLVRNLGGVGAPIVLRGEDKGVIFDGQSDAAIGFWCEECIGITVDNLTFRNYTDVGIGVYRSVDVIFTNLTVYNNGFAVQMTEWEFEGYGIQVDESKQVVIENSDVFQNGPNPQIFPDYLMGTGINMYQCTDCVIRGNKSHNNIGGGILVEDSSNILIAGNEVYENDLDASIDGWWDGGLWVDGGNNIIVRSNVFLNNLGPGIEISDEDNQKPYGYVLENNVSTGNYYGIYIWNFGSVDLPHEDILQMVNNQITGNLRKNVWISDWECPPDDPCD